MWQSHRLEKNIWLLYVIATPTETTNIISVLYIVAFQFRWLVL